MGSGAAALLLWRVRVERLLLSQGDSVPGVHEHAAQVPDGRGRLGLVVVRRVRGLANELPRHATQTVSLLSSSPEID